MGTTSKKRTSPKYEFYRVILNTSSTVQMQAFLLCGKHLTLLKLWTEKWKHHGTQRALPAAPNASYRSQNAFQILILSVPVRPKYLPFPGQVSALSLNVLLFFKTIWTVGGKAPISYLDLSFVIFTSVLTAYSHRSFTIFLAKCRFYVKFFLNHASKSLQISLSPASQFLLWPDFSIWLK